MNPTVPVQKNIYELDLSHWQQIILSMGEPAYRAQQVWHNLYHGLVASADAMTDIPRSLREEIGRRVSFFPLENLCCLESSDGETRKYLFRLSDGALIETVLMSYERRETACLSTQAGCGMGCLFCATGMLGLTRSLTAGEIVAQGMEMARFLRKSNKNLSNIVLMGMGEPFANYDATLQAIHRWIDPSGFCLGARRITVSTVGIAPGIRRFAGEQTQVNLAVSLHAANDALRDGLLPVNRAYPLKELMSACAEYISTTNRRISMEWALMKGINDGDKDAEELAALLHSVPHPLFHVNIILLNPVAGFHAQPASNERQRVFQQKIEKSGVPCTIRLRRGLDILAGCGQLALFSLPETNPLRK